MSYKPLSQQRFNELSSKKLWEITPEEFLQLNGGGAFIQYDNAELLIKLTRLENHSHDARKAIMQDWAVKPYHKNNG